MLARGDFDLEIKKLAFQIGRIHLGLIDQFGIDPEADFGGHGLVRPVTVQDQAHAINAIHGEAMNRMGGVSGTKPGEIIIHQIERGRFGATQDIQANRNRIMADGGLQLSGAKHCGSYRNLRGIGVLFEKHRRDIERIADVVKSKRRLILRKDIGERKVDSQQIANGVVVFGAIQAASGDQTGIGLNQGILPGKLTFQPTCYGVDIFSGSFGNTGGRHFARLHFAGNMLPNLAIFRERSWVTKGKQIHAARSDASVVAGNAFLLNERERSRGIGQKRCYETD